MLRGKSGEIVSRRESLSQCGRVGSPAEAEGEKNAIFKLNLFNYNYSFMIRYWLLLCLFLPPFLF